MTNFVDWIKHVVLWIFILLYVAIGFTISEALYDEKGETLAETRAEKGYILTFILYIPHITIYLGIPLAAVNIFGIILFNPFVSRTSKIMPKGTPFLCFRVVTRGLFPNLVQQVTDNNVKIVLSLGIQNFNFEVVTDTPLHLKTSHYVREIVVPTDYKTPNRTLFKARALHYCLGQHINILSKNDWIVHLDEETRLTEQVLYGIVKFVNNPSSQIGQGVITYGEMEIENWLTTLLDGVRTALDYGLFRVSFQTFHRPIFGFKGSFVVVKMSVEEDVGFDFGTKECIAEDLRFALTAWVKGYRFDYIYGNMQEKSTFSVSDFIKQRKRWLIGHYHIIWNNSLPGYCKFVLMPMHIGNLLLWLNIFNAVLPFVYPVPLAKWQLQLFLLMSAILNFIIAFGNFMSLGHRRFKLQTKLCVCLLSQLLIPVLGVLEAYAAVAGFIHRNNISFDIVQKEATSKRPAALENGIDLIDI